MWRASGNAIEMVVGDYGIALPITISGITIGASDSIKFTVVRDNGVTVFEKTYTNISNNTISVELTEEETDAINPGDYMYVIDWYQDDAFKCNIVRKAPFSVVRKG